MRWRSFLLLVVPVLGHSSLGAKRWLQAGPIQIQPSEIMKIGLVLALARFYHGLSPREAALSWKLLNPGGADRAFRRFSWPISPTSVPRS